jgi:hypothetical protein
MTILRDTKLVLYSPLVPVLIRLSSLRNASYLRNLSNITPTQANLIVNIIRPIMTIVTIMAIRSVISTTLHF